MRVNRERISGSISSTLQRRHRVVVDLDETALFELFADAVDVPLGDVGSVRDRTRFRLPVFENREVGVDLLRRESESLE